MFNLFRLPLGAFSPHDLLYVYEDDGRLAGLLRVERESHRDEWTIVELDGIGHAEAGDIRFRLVQHLLRDGSKRGAVRFHVACADADGNVELFMQAGFARYGDEIVLSRPAGTGAADAVDRGRDGGPAGIRPAVALDALALARLYATATPQPVQRLEAAPARRLGAAGDRLAGAARRRSRPSSASPTSRRSPRRREGGGSDGTLLDGFVQVGVAKEDQPHYLKILVRPGADIGPLVRASGSGSSPRGRPRTAATATTTASSLRSGRTSTRSIGPRGQGLLTRSRP